MNFIKPIVAGPGDTLAVQDGHVVRNGMRQSEPFIEACGAGPECNRSNHGSARPLLHDGRQPWSL
ncbi:MAG TPA: hypothetical protein VNA28_12365 [Solirubrobacteraceae bacterium]|nr:hypothetical protein [Solirubrobacteraceae bacterium]